MEIIKKMKGVLRNMAKVQLAKPGAKVSRSILGKRKLCYTYSGFISSTSRPPLASPKLEKNSGVKKDAGA